MAFLPIDLQVSFQQAASVADQAAAEKEGPQRAREQKGRDMIEQKQEEENIIEEDQKLKSNKTQEEPGRGGAGGGDVQEEDENNEDSSDQSPEKGKEPGKGKFLDLKT